MADQYLADEILAAIRLRAKLPEDDETWSDANLLRILNSELQAWGAPFLVAARGEFLNTYIDHTTVANQAEYPVPPLAVNGVIRVAQALDSGGNPWPMQQIDIQDLGPFTAISSGTPTAFYIQGDSVVLTAPPTSSQWTLRFVYARRPSQVVLAAECAQITNVAGNVVTCSGGFPATFTNGTAMDFVHGESSFLTFRGTPTMPAPSGNTATFSSLPTGLKIGDWLCLRNQAPFPQIPADIQPVLEQRVVATVLRAEGDDKAAVEWKQFEAMEADARGGTAPRVPGNAKGLRGTLNRYGGGWSGGGRW